MSEEFLRMAGKWLEGAAELRQETATKPFTKIPRKRAAELISVSLSIRSCYSFESRATNG